MSVKRPGSPLSSGAESLEPLDSKDLQKSISTGQLASQLDALETAASSGGESAGEVSSPKSEALQQLWQIAANADLSTPEQALAAIRESAQFLINSRINQKLREQQKVFRMVEELSDFVAEDPFLGTKIKKILERLKEDRKDDESAFAQR